MAPKYFSFELNQDWIPSNLIYAPYFFLFKSVVHCSLKLGGVVGTKIALGLGFSEPSSSLFRDAFFVLLRNFSSPPSDAIVLCEKEEIIQVEFLRTVRMRFSKFKFIAFGNQSRKHISSPRV